MQTITLTGTADPSVSFALRQTLEPLTSGLRPAVVVDLSDVDDLHPSVVSVLLRQRRQARRLSGSLHVIPPNAPAARATLDQIGLVGARR